MKLGILMLCLVAMTAAIFVVFWPDAEAIVGPYANQAGQMSPGNYYDPGPPEVHVRAYDHDQDGWADSLEVEIDGNICYLDWDAGAGQYAGQDLGGNWLFLEHALPNHFDYWGDLDRGSLDWQ